MRPLTGKWLRATTLAAVSISGACDVSVGKTFRDPPPGSYTSATRQLKFGDTTIAVPSAAVTPDFFPAVGAPPLMGRFFSEGDERSSTARVAVLSHDLWQRHFGSRPEVIGTVIDLDGQRAVVVGVAQPRFRAPDGALMWTPRSDR